MLAFIFSAERVMHLRSRPLRVYTSFISLSLIKSAMLQPIGDHILVKPHTKEETTKGGIVLPGSAQEKPQTGEIIAVGQGKYVGDKLVTFKEQGLDKGVTIMFSKYGPTEIKIENEDYYILESHDILGIIKK